MTVNPQAQTLLDAAARAEAAGAPAPQELGAVELRALFKATRGELTPEPPDVEHVEDLSVPGPAGSVPVRYYRPKGANESAKLPMLLYFHGGGWMVGDIETHDVLCRMLANRGRFAVANVDYRLAPENKFPAAIEDSWAVTQWAINGAGGLSIDTGRIGVGGDSAGGNISAVLALMARDAGLSLAFQALIYPATHFSLETESHYRFANGYLLTRDAQAWYHESYLRSAADRDHWWASPALAADFTNVAPAFVLTCGYDPLFDEGKAYADLLKAAGVPVAYRCFDGQVHGFITMGKVIDEANEAVTDVAKRVAAAFYD